MGTRGPAPTPTDVLKARGSWRADRNPHEPRDDVGLSACPEFLDDEGRAEWRRLAPLLKKRGTVFAASAGVLAGLCQNWSLFVRASRKVNELMQSPAADGMDLRRWTATANEAFKNYVRAAQEFGITPASRTRLTTLPEKAPAGDKASDKARFFRVG